VCIVGRGRVNCRRGGVEGGSEGLVPIGHNDNESFTRKKRGNNQNIKKKNSTIHFGLAPSSREMVTDWWGGWGGFLHKEQLTKCRGGVESQKGWKGCKGW